MKRQIVSTLNPASTEIAYNTILGGGVVVLPTDTVYGISVRYDRASAIEKIYAIKQRGKEKALPILIGSADQLEFVAAEIPMQAQKLMEAFWPGALTLILPKHENLPHNLSEYATIGVRMPNHPFILELMKKCGPLATTSANLSGGPNPTSIEEVLQQLDQGVDLYLDGGKTAGDVPSTVVDCSGREIQILREGLIPSASLLKALGN